MTNLAARIRIWRLAVVAALFAMALAALAVGPAYASRIDPESRHPNLR
jgi:hypothetical protein